MKILRVAQKVYPEYKGGGAYHVHALSRDQVKKGHEVTVLTLTENESLPRRQVRAGYTILRETPTMQALGNDISYGVGKILRTADEYDVIHAHSHIYFSTVLAAVTRRFGATPLAITNHGLYSQNAPKWLFDGYLRTIARWTFNQADVALCYTPTDRTRLRSLGITSRIDVVPNGVDTKRFAPDGAESEYIDHDGNVVLFVGRLVKGKRPGDAVKAVNQLPADLNARLYVIGDGPLREELEAMAGANVKFLGQVPYDDMPAVYRAGDVTVLPSRAEGLPRTVLESFASGVPVVSSSLEHISGLVQQGGETVEVGDVDGYTDAIEWVLRAQPTSDDIRDIVVSKYDWRDTVAKTTTTLEGIS